MRAGSICSNNSKVPQLCQVVSLTVLLSTLARRAKVEDMTRSLRLIEATTFRGRLLGERADMYQGRY